MLNGLDLGLGRLNLIQSGPADTWTANNEVLSAALDANIKAQWNMADVTDSVGSNDWTNNGVSFGAGFGPGIGTFADSSDSMSQTMGADLKINGEFSVSTWVNFTVLPTVGNTMTFFYSNPSNLNWIAQVTNAAGTYYIQFKLWETDGGDSEVYEVATLAIDTWYNFVFTADTDTTHVYHNGSELGSGTAWDGTVETDAGTLYFGQKGDSTRWLNAQVGQTLFLDTAISQANAALIYNSGTGSFRV